MTEGVTELLWRGVPFGFSCSSLLSSSFSWPSRHGSVVLCGMRQFEWQRMGAPLFYQWKTLWSSPILSILAFLVFLDPDQQIKRRFILTIVTIGALLLLLFSELLGSTKHPVTVGEWRSRALCHCCRRSTTLAALVVIMTGRGTSKRVCLTRSSRISGWSALLLVCMNSALPTFVYILIL